VAELVGCRACRPGDDTRRKRGVRLPPQGPRLGGLRAQRPGAAHLRGAPARRRTDHAQGARGRVRRLARARAPDMRACPREGTEVGEEGRRCDGNSSASASALASNPLQWWRTANGRVAMSALYGNQMRGKGDRSLIKAPKFASYP